MAAFTAPSTLTLLVSRILAHDTNHTLSLENLAVPAYFLYRCPNFHNILKRTIQFQSSDRNYLRFMLDFLSSPSYWWVIT